eukprot:CAMPEP_0172919040 /NCGR_PEP_ID=MMETSP1075-20121228/201382_1 /TAXON_ID=2916 /ORGANISM="Ceratium fusus, Strain PA161109" /LENGTH=187 /DNA_ID=CAMNT_0013778805 /DNA_START=65 /DNA_END=625 /DNA_ORIENTATION=-
MAEARGLLKQAASNKKGWGWAVNNGEIYVAQGAWELLSVALRLKLQRAPVNSVGDPGDEKVVERETMVTSDDLRIALEQAQSSWGKAMRRTSSDRNGADFHPWQDLMDSISEVASQTKQALADPVGKSNRLNELVSRCEELSDAMAKRFHFPGRASSRQFLEAHGVVPWISETTSSAKTARAHKTEE